MHTFLLQCKTKMFFSFMQIFTKLFLIKLKNIYKNLKKSYFKLKKVQIL